MKGKSLMALLGCFVLGSSGSAVAMEEFTLDTIVVTANRDKVPEMETPSAVTVITKEEIDRSGARNVYEALQFIPGVYFNGWGAKGVDFGDHNTTLSVRGVDQGASVILNGVPITANNFSQLSAIPKESIERIEVVKGASGVLYGPETMTGVINIITDTGEKKLPCVRLEGAVGNGSNKDFFVGYEDRWVNLGYAKTYIGPQSPTTDPYWGWFTETDVYGHRKNSTQENLFLTLRPTAHWSLFYNASWSHMVWGETAVEEAERWQKSYDDTYRVRSNNCVLSYEAKDQKANVFYSDRTSHLRTETWAGDGFDSAEDYKTRRYGFDAQKTFSFGNARQLIVGMTADKEQYRELVGTNAGHRMQYALYGQYTWQVNDRYKTILGLRYQHAAEDASNQAQNYTKHYNEIIPQWQNLYHLSPNEVLYTNVGKSFILPRLYDYFYTDIDRALKPEAGWNYEIGYKVKQGKDDWRIAFFYIDVRDKIKVFRVTGKPNKMIRNVGAFKNPGIEVQYSHVITDGWQYHIGFTYANPRNEENGVWTQTFPRFQMAAGTSYHQGPWNAALNLGYAALRPHQIKNMLDVTLNVSYQISPADTVSLAVYNLLDRRDVTTEWDWIAYYSDPRTVMLRYAHTF